MENAFIPCGLASLESFKLQFGRDNSEDPPVPPIPVFFDMLRSLSNIRTLTLDNFIPMLPPKRAGDEPLFAFPHLRELCLGGDMTTCQILWPYLQLLPDTRVKIEVEDEDEDRSLATHLAFMEAISGHFVSSNCPKIVGLSVDDDQHEVDQRLRLVFAIDKPGVTLESWTCPLASDHRFLLDIRLTGWKWEGIDVDAGPFINLLERIHELYNLHDLKIIELAPIIGSSPARWKDALSRYRSVTTFAIDPFPPHQGLWEALCPQTLAGGESHILPNLEVIAIETTRDFDHYQLSYDDDDPAMPANWSDFCPGLERRVAAGAGVKRVLFANFMTNDVERAEELLLELRAVIPEVTCTPTRVDRGPLVSATAQTSVYG